MLATDAYLVTLRIVHIVTGVIWVGLLIAVSALVVRLVLQIGRGD